MDRASGKNYMHRKGDDTPYTGYCYRVFQSHPKDTGFVQYYDSGILKMEKRYGESTKLNHYFIRYKNLRNDTITAETFDFDENSGDTIGYTVDYIDKNGAKWERTVYYYTSTMANGKHARVQQIMYARFFKREDTKDFSGQYSPPGKFYTDDRYFDAMGYTNFAYRQGWYVKYYQNGNKMQEGMYSEYDHALSHPHSWEFGEIKTGIWKTYYMDGPVSCIQYYDSDGQLRSTQQYYLSGKTISVGSYYKKGSDIHLPPTQGIPFFAEDSFRVDTHWYENGVIMEEVATDANYDPKYRVTHYCKIVYGFYEDGKPAKIAAYAAMNDKPIGIHKTWNPNGTVSSFINYSVETNDTVCFTAYENGKIKMVNLKPKATRLNRDSIPVSYGYGSGPDEYLMRKVFVHRVYFPDGKLFEEFFLNHNKREGSSRRWFANGQLAISAAYIHDTLDGNYREWDSLGRLKRNFNFKNGIRNGVCTEYYENGKIKWQNTYTNGIPGKPQGFDASGTIIVKKGMNHLNAFFPDSLHLAAREYFEEEAFYFYSIVQQKQPPDPRLTIPDSALTYYEDLNIIIHHGDTAKHMVAPNRDFSGFPVSDLHHASFNLYGKAYSDTLVQQIRIFFQKSNIFLDSIVKKKYWNSEIYYEGYFSSGEVLNFTSISNHLTKDFYVNPGYISLNGDGGYGYYSNYPGRNQNLENKNGYVVVMYGYGGNCDTCVTRSSYFFYVYSDFSYDYAGSRDNYSGMRYWPYDLFDRTWMEPAWTGADDRFPH